jgi:protein TonB
MAFFASLLIHAGILIASPNIFMAGSFQDTLRAFKVDLIRPPMDEIREQSKDPHPQAGNDPIDQKKEEATISLNTTDELYYPYATVVKKRIEQHWTYPASAREQYMQGDLMIVFRLERNGHLVSSRIVHSSGYQILDGSSIKAIELASPFPPFPDTIPVQILNINASFAYRLKYTD